MEPSSAPRFYTPLRVALTGAATTLLISGCALLSTSATYRCNLTNSFSTILNYTAKQPSGADEAYQGFNGITVDPSSNLFVVGGAMDSTYSVRSQINILKSSDGGSSWKLVHQTFAGVALDGSSNPYSGSQLYQVATTLSGTLFSVGSITTVAGVSGTAKGMTYKSTDKGETWSEVDSYSNTGYYAEFKSVAVDYLRGYVLVAGGYANPTNSNGAGKATWIVRRSTTGGGSGSWSTVFTLDSDTLGTVSNSAQNIFMDASGNYYVSGYYRTGGTGANWAVFRSTNGGASWAEITGEHYQLSAGKLSGVTAGGIDLKGNLFFLGHDRTAGNIEGVRIRRSTDGTNFTTVYTDAQSAVSNNYFPTGFAVDRNGTIYASVCKDKTWCSIWKVIRSTDNGTTWSTVESLSLTSGGDSSPMGIGVDLYNNVYAVGYNWLVTPDVQQGVVRKMNCQ